MIGDHVAVSPNVAILRVRHAWRQVQFQRWNNFDLESHDPARCKVTLYGILFLIVVASAAVLVVAAFVSLLSGKPGRAFKLTLFAVLGVVFYIGVVYVSTALSTKQLVPRGTSFCNDDWCLAVDTVKQNSEAIQTRYDITLRISSLERGRAQRENGATDVFLEDSQGRRFEPLSGPPDVLLNVLLQPGQSVKAQRHFDVPIESRDIRLGIGRVTILPFCTVIGECAAFGKGTMFLLD